MKKQHLNRSWEIKIPDEMREYFLDNISVYLLTTSVFLTLILISVIGSCSCTRINKYFGVADNNIAEEILEEIIEAKTGLDIDLSDTPE